MTRQRKLGFALAAALLGTLSLGADSCGPFGLGSPLLYFKAPLFSQLSLPQGVELELQLGHFVDRQSLVVELDEQPLDPSAFQTLPGNGLGTTLPALAEGGHVLTAKAELRIFFFIRIPLHAATRFDIADLQRPDECEILNDVHCLLPYPSSRFLVPDATTATGFRSQFPSWTVPGLIGPPIDPSALNVYDGFAPTVQVMAHLPGADLVQSDASRLLPGAPQSPPYVDLRTHTTRSLDPDSPTLLIDADTGLRVLHWVELDANTLDPQRQVLFLRPAQSLIPGHRYIVALRRIKDASGNKVQPEAVFRALRDRAPSTIPAVEARRDGMEEIFELLKGVGVGRHALQLAFDFRVRSDEQLTERLLFMRDDALAYLASIAPGDISGFTGLTVQNVSACTAPSDRIWRRVSGNFAGPNYMNGNIDNPAVVSLLNVDANRMPVRNGTFPMAFDVAVPCDVFLGTRVGHPLMLGHGFLGRGSDMVGAFVAGGFFGTTTDVSYIAGGTDWRGLSRGLNGPDALSILFNVIGAPALGGHKFNNFNTLPNRLKQGVVNTLVLSRMMKSGFFNRLPAFRRVAGDPATGVFTPSAEAFYFGVSLGGIYGTLFAATNQDVIRHNIDVPAMNFSVLQQRSTQFPTFLTLINQVGLTDPMELAVVLQVQHEMWVSADPAAYVRHITGLVEPPLPNTPAKQLLMTVSFLDKQVSNQASEMLARSLGIPNLVGSIQAQLPGIPDVADGSGQPSALVIYDTGYFNVFDPAHAPFLPPLANVIPSSKCDPHGTPRLSIPASVQQLGAFLKPGGRIFNFCDGICDAQIPAERPTTPCNPLQ